MGRFNSRSHHQVPPTNEETVGTHPHPSEGHPEHGIPPYPDPLPGEHRYPDHEPVVPEKLDVGTARPYYTGGVAHGVRSPVVHGGRPAPHHHDRDYYRTEAEAFPEEGEWRGKPVPVEIVSAGSGTHNLQQAAFRQVGFQPGADPQILLERNDQRITAYVLNETSSGGLRLKVGPTSEVGALLPPNQNRYFPLPTQDAVYAVCDPSANAEQLISVIEIFKTTR